MTSPRDMSWRWILIGAFVISGIHFMIHPEFARTIGGWWDTILGPEAAVTAYLATVELISFFFGGLIVGWMSPGTTLKEPAVAGVIAALINNVRDYMYWPDQFHVVTAILALGVGFGTAFVGAMLGEKLQGDTTEKMRERDDFHLEKK